MKRSTFRERCDDDDGDEDDDDDEEGGVYSKRTLGREGEE